MNITETLQFYRDIQKESPEGVEINVSIPIGKLDEIIEYFARKAWKDGNGTIDQGLDWEEAFNEYKNSPEYLE